MTQKLASINEVENKIVPVLKRYKVRRAGIFGSLAHGQLKPGSDVDVLVEMPKKASLLDLSGLKTELEETTGREVDVVEYEAIKPAIKERVLAEQIYIL